MNSFNLICLIVINGINIFSEASSHRESTEIWNIREDPVESVKRTTKNYTSSNSDYVAEKSVPQETLYDLTSIKTPKTDIVQPLIVSFVLVVDQTAYQMLGKDVNRVNQFCIQLISHMNSLFSKLFLKIVLVDVITWSEEDSFQISHEVLKTMTDFSDFNRNYLLNNSNHTHAQLITGKEQYDDLKRLNFGRAQLNTICTDASSSVVMLHDLHKPELQAVTNTHELAHSLNIKHTGRKCPECIMSPEADRSLSTPADKWTVGNIQDLTGIVEKKACLFHEEPKQQFEKSTKYTTTYRTGDSCSQAESKLNIWRFRNYVILPCFILFLFLFCLIIRHRLHKASLDYLIPWSKIKDHDDENSRKMKSSQTRSTNRKVQIDLEGVFSWLEVCKEKNDLIIYQNFGYHEPMELKCLVNIYY